MATKTVKRLKRGNTRGNGAAKVPAKAKKVNRIAGLVPAEGAGDEKSKESQRIVIQPPDLRTFDVTLVGTSPLIEHKFSEKARQQIEAKQQHKAKAVRGKRDPKAEYLAACYVMPKSKAGAKGCKYAIPAVTIKAAMVDACRLDSVDMPMTRARILFHVLDEQAGMVPLKFRGHPVMREDTIRLPTGSLDLRYRPEFANWSVTVKIRYNAREVSAEQIVNLLALAGIHCGLCELRPNSKSGPGGSNGLFEVAST